VLNEFCDRLSMCTWSLQEGPFPTRWPGAFVLLVRDNAGLDFLLHNRQEGFCPAGELSRNNKRQVMRNIVGFVVVAD
jgi:hypothetical protein